MQKRLTRKPGAIRRGKGSGDKAKKTTMEFLPGDYPGYPPASCVIFDFDARGYTPVVVDLLASKNMSSVLFPLLAQEFHHYYRNRMLTKHKVFPDLKPLFWVVDQIHCERLADRIDKRPKIIKGNPQMDSFCPGSG